MARFIRPAAQPPPKTVSFSPLFADNLRHLVWERGKNSRKTSEKSLKNGEEWRFFEGQSAILTSVYARGTEAQTAGALRLTSATPAASSELLTANLELERHFSLVSGAGELRSL